MQPPSTPEAKKRGRPPNLATRQAILDTAYRIVMDEGLGRLTVERVALEAGVGKPTIYRSWTNAQELAMAAFMSRPAREPAQPRALSAREAFKVHLAGVVRAFASNRGRQITLTMASADPDSELAKAFRNQIILKGREGGRLLIEAAIKAGETRLQTDIETVLDMVYGPVFYRLLAGHQKLSAEFAAQIVDTIFDGIATPA